jgi:RND family efflux transporter MFP subunit
MKMLPVRTSVVLLLACTALVSGCGRGKAAQAPKHDGEVAQYVAVSRGTIAVEGGLLPLSAAVPGVVDAVKVHVGDHVHDGQVLATLKSGDARAAVDIARGRLAQAQAQAQLIALQLKAARQRARTLQQAAAAGADAGQDATDAASKADQLAARSAAAKAAVTVARGTLEQARHALERHTLRAPLAAQVSEVHVQPGESVSAQSGPLFTLLPDAPRIVEAEINSDYVAKVHKGMRAQIVLNDDNDEPVGTARVTFVGQVFGPSKLAEDPSVRANTRTVQCRLRFDHPQALRIGQRVLVRFLPGHGATH